MGDLTPAMRSLRSRMAAYTLHSLHDPRETTAAARQAFEDRFVREVDPNLELPVKERMRRAAAARKAYFTRLAYLSARKRAGRRRG